MITTGSNLHYIPAKSNIALTTAEILSRIDTTTAGGCSEGAAELNEIAWSDCEGTDREALKHLALHLVLRAKWLRAKAANPSKSQTTLVRQFSHQLDRARAILG